MKLAGSKKRAGGMFSFEDIKEKKVEEEKTDDNVSVDIDLNQINV